MTDQIDKALAKLTEQERKKISEVLACIRRRDVAAFDIRKLKGHKNIFRIRVGPLRILFRVDQNEQVYILAVERRNDTTYNF